MKKVILLCFSIASLLVKANTYTVNNLNDAGAGTLRQAITDANTNPGTDQIVFTTSGQINLNSDLPTIQGVVTIDGFSATGYTTGNPSIIVRGSGGDVFHFVNTGSQSIVKGISFLGGADAIELDGCSLVQVIGCWFGLNTTGTAVGSPLSQSGIRVSNGATNNTIGGIGLANRNVFMAVNNEAIRIESNSTKNKVVGNYIGLAKNGLTAGANVWGIFINNSSDNIIGGAVAGEGNIVCASTVDGIRVEENSRKTIVKGNYIGIASDGNSGKGNNEHGILFINGSDSAVVGGVTIAERNYAGNNGQNGFSINNSTGISVINNYSGINVLGTAALKNGWSGLSFSGGSGFIIRDNVFSGNNNEGVYVRDVQSATFSGNYIGVTPTGNAVMRNRLQGISVNNSNNVVIEKGNIISGNGDQGIQLNEAKNTIIKGNIIGLNAAKTVAIPNEQHGIEVKSNSTSTIIGGVLAAERNVISGNAKNGIFLNANTATIENNSIGSDLNGTLQLPNGENGIEINNSSNHSIKNNTIAFNVKNGINVSNSSSNNVIRNNTISKNTNGVFVSDSNSKGNEITQNTFNCNSTRAINLNGTLLVGVGNNNKKTPTINQSSTISNLNGTADPLDVIEIYSRDNCSSSNICKGAIQVQGMNYIATVNADASGKWSFNSTLSVNAYSVTATSRGAKNTSEFAVLTLAIPKINASNASFCEGSKVDLTTDTIQGFNYQWFNSASQIQSGLGLTKIEVADQGTYSVKISHPTDDGSGKCSVTSAGITVSKDLLPSKADAGLDQIICTGATTSVLDAVSPAIGTGNWSSTNGTITSVTNAKSGVTNLQIGKTIFVWTVTNGVCPASVDSITIERALQLSDAEAGPDQLMLCEGSSVQLAGSVPKVGEEVLWESAGITIQNQTTANASVTTLAAGDYVFKYTVSNDLCGSSKDSMRVVVTALPKLTGVTGDNAICFNDGSTGTAEVVGTNIQNVVWILPSNLSISSVLNNSMEYEFADTLGALIKVTASNGNCSSNDTLSLSISRIRVETPDFNKGNASCAGIENTLKVINPIPSIVYEWGIPADASSTPNGLEAITIVTPNTETYTVSLVADKDGCVSEPVIKELKVFKIVESLNMSGLVGDPIINAIGKCDEKDQRFESTTVLKANVFPAGLDDLTFVWERMYKGDTIQLASTVDSVVVDFGLDHGFQTYRVTVANNNCIDNTLLSTDSINVLESIEAEFEMKQNNVICEGDFVELKVRNILHSTEHDKDVKYVWSHNNYTIETDIRNSGGIDSLAISQLNVVAVPTQVVLKKEIPFTTYENYETLTGGNQIVYDNYKVKASIGDQVQVKAIPEYCIVYNKLDGDKKLTSSVAVPVVSRPGALASAFDLRTNEAGIYINKDQLLSGGYSLLEGELLLGQSSDRFGLYDKTNREGFTFETGKTENDLVRNWYHVVSTDSLSKEFIKTPNSIIAYPELDKNAVANTFMLKVENEACADSSFVVIRYEFAPWPPNAFSPNGDGKFDKFEIQNVDKYEGTKVTIFNRWGTKIVEIENYHLKENWWDGTKNGDPLPTGAYFYLIDFNNELEGITGVVSLIK